MPTRAENRRTTLLALGEAATSLFESDGPSVTIEAIAEAAGMSRRTISRYVDAKEELAFVHPLLWWEVFAEALTDHADVAPVDRLQIASSAIAAHIDGDPDPPRRAFRVAATHPELLSGFNSVFRLWVDRLTGVIEAMLKDSLHADLADGGLAHRLESRIVASAIMGMVDAITRDWVFAESATYGELGDEGFETLRPILERTLGSPEDP